MPSILPPERPTQLPEPSSRKCTCNADAYSLNPSEVVVHRLDGPCTIEPALRATIAAWDFDHERLTEKVYIDMRWRYACRCGETFLKFDDIYWHRIDALSSILTAGVNDGPGYLLPDGADDAPDESKGDAGPIHPASHSAPAVDPTEPYSLRGATMSAHEAGKQVGAAYQQGLADARRLLVGAIEEIARTPDGEREWQNQGRSGVAKVVDVDRLRRILSSGVA